jgi:hypothetical protein
MCLGGYPKKHASRLHPMYKRDQPVPLLSQVPGPRLNLDSKPPHLGPASMRCLDLHLSPPPINRSGKSQSPWQDSNKPFRSHKQVCARDNKFMTWPGSMQWTVLNQHGQGNSATQLCPVAAEHNLSHPPIPIPYPYPVTISFPSFYHEFNHNNNHLLWVTIGYSRYR